LLQMLIKSGAQGICDNDLMCRIMRIFKSLYLFEEEYTRHDVLVCEYGICTIKGMVQKALLKKNFEVKEMLYAAI